jgi:signal transduction histidine kinase
LKPISVQDLLEGIRAVIQPLAAQKRVTLEMTCDSGCTIVADHELLHRMLLNLVLNALRETPTHGSIQMTAKHGVTITVEDSGPGIPEATISRIFDPMFSTHRDGSGLGLPIVKRIVDSHNGTIRVESSKSGTRFIITFFHNMEVVSEPLTRS